MPRQKKPISEEQVEKLAAINCSYKEIASVVGCNESTLTRRFAQVIEKGRDVGKSSLKRKMWEIAMGGNVSMCIWLSKQMLGYRDKNEFEDISKPKEQIVYVSEWGSYDPIKKDDPNT